MVKIDFKSFFNGVKATIEKDKNIDIQIKNLIKKDGFNFNDYFKNCSDTLDIIPTLQKTNEYFIKNCEIHIDENLVIVPIETEIYFANNYFFDGMCYMNELQKGFLKDEKDEKKERFGKLYFHRDKKNDILSLKTTMGGMDICLSGNDEEDEKEQKYYYLSILIRSAFIINGIKEKDLKSGINNVVKEVINNICEEKDDKQEKLKTIKTIEKEKIVLSNRKETTINIDNIFCQSRIVGNKYHEGTKIYKLNCLNLGESLTKENKEKNKYKYDYLFLNLIKQKFYTETKKQDIENNFKKQKRS